MRKIFSILILLAFFMCETVTAQKFIVVIDPGHGGKDGGAIRGNAKEKDINLAVALQLGKYIQAKHPDTKVIYTRSTDVFIELDKRPTIANKAKANLFISIHVNSTAEKTTKAFGPETYIVGESRNKETLEVAKRENSVILLEDNYKTRYEGFDPRSPESYIIFEFMANKYLDQSLDFAKLVQQEMKNVAKRNGRGVRQDVFWVLRKTSMPSVLIELGFINNVSDVAFMTSVSGQRSLASAIFSAFEKYKLDFLSKQGGISPSSTTKAINSSNIRNNNIDTVITKRESNLDMDSSSDNITQKATNYKVKTTTQQSNNKQKENTVVQKTSIKTDEIEYRTQFLVSSVKLDLKSASFKNLDPDKISYYKDGKSYKYTYGSTSDHKEAINLQREVRKKFPDAFVIKFKNGIRIIK